jgi:hypothetical protein
VIRRAAPWEARTWEYWEQGQTISGAGVYRRTATGYYVSTGAGTTGATEPNWLTGTSTDGGVSWTTGRPNIDSGIFSADQWGQLATNTAPVTAVGIYSKSDKYSPGGGQNNFYLEADGVSREYVANDRVERHQQVNGTIETKARWDKEALVLELRASKRTTVVRRYALRAGHLDVTTEIDGGPRHAKRVAVYERHEGGPPSER